MHLLPRTVMHCRRLQSLVRTGQGAGDAFPGAGDAVPAPRSAAMWALLAGLLVLAGLQGWISGAQADLAVELPPLLQLMAGLLPITGGALTGWLALWLIIPGVGWRRLGMVTPVRLGVGRGLKIMFRLLLPVCLGCLLINVATYLLLRAGGVTEFPPQQLEVLGRKAGVGYWLVAALITIVLAPLVEEFVFRLLLYRTLQGAGLRFPGVLCSLIFAGAHMLPYGVPGLAFLALILQGCALRWGLRQAMFVHSAYNAVMFSLLLLHRLQAAPAG